MPQLPADRCSDCGYSIALHFRSQAAARSPGQFAGCPVPSVAGRLNRDRDWPRFTLRVRAGQTIAAWVDCQTDEGEVWLWNLDTGLQYWGRLREHQDNSKRVTGDSALDVADRLRDLVGGPVRIVKTASKTRKGNSQ